jgi:hypothetical protein
MGGGARGIVVSSPPKASLYIVGRGAPLPPPQGSQGRRPGRRRVAAARVCGGQLAPKTLTMAGLGQGSMAPFFCFPHGLLSVNWPIR